MDGPRLEWETRCGEPSGGELCSRKSGRALNRIHVNLVVLSLVGRILEHIMTAVLEARAIDRRRMDTVLLYLQPSAIGTLVSSEKITLADEEWPDHECSPPKELKERDGSTLSYPKRVIRAENTYMLYEYSVLESYHRDTSPRAKDQSRCNAE